MNVTLALLTAGGGAFTGLLAAAAEVTDKTDPSSVAPWVQGLGNGAAVAGLVYVARMMVKGDLVPRPVKDAEVELAAAIRAAGEREARLMQVVEEQREWGLEMRGTLAAHMAQTNDIIRTATLCQETVRQATDEMSRWRERRER